MNSAPRDRSGDAIGIRWPRSGVVRLSGALVRRPSILHQLLRASGAFATVTALSLFAASPAPAQLRPLEPVDWTMLESGYTVHAAAGVAGFNDHYASLAGTRGRLLELGNYRVAWRMGRVVIEAAGTAFRVFEDEREVAPPAGNARPPDGSTRVDTGDHQIGTLVQLTPPGASSAVALRFGTRLPTTDNRIGLDRDETDFFATFAARTGPRALELSAEAGLGINGSRAQGVDQADVLLYSASLAYDAGSFSSVLSIAGQDDLRAKVTRGNEDLAEVRAGVLWGDHRWIRVEAVAGLRRASPQAGLRVTGGWRR